MMYIFTQSHDKNFTPNVPHIPKFNHLHFLRKSYDVLFL